MTDLNLSLFGLITTIQLESTKINKSILANSDFTTLNNEKKERWNWHKTVTMVLNTVQYQHWKVVRLGCYQNIEQYTNVPYSITFKNNKNKNEWCTKWYQAICSWSDINLLVGKYHLEWYILTNIYGSIKVSIFKHIPWYQYKYHFF